MTANLDGESAKTAQTAPATIGDGDIDTHPQKTEIVTADDTVTGTHMMTGTGHPDGDEARARPALALRPDDAHEALRPRKPFNDLNAPSLPKQTRTLHPT